MASKKDYLKMLNERKNDLIEFLDEYNKLCIEVVNDLVNERYANLDIKIVQSRVPDIPEIVYGYYSEIEIKGKSQRLQDIYQKKDTIAGHERRLEHRGSSYVSLKKTIRLSFERDVRHNIVNSKQFAKLVEKFDAYGFSPAVLVPLSHLLFFEFIRLVPESYEGQKPSYYSALKFFLENLSSAEFELGKDAPHRNFHKVDYWMVHSDFVFDSLKG